MQFWLDTTIELSDATKHVLLVVETVHSQSSDPLRNTARPAPGTAVVFQLQEVWDARSTREYGDNLYFLDSSVRALTR